MKKPQIVAVEFYDHTEGDGDINGVVKCWACGVLVFEDKKEIRICSWYAENSLDHNSKVFSVLKSTILRRRNLK